MKGSGCKPAVVSVRLRLDARLYQLVCAAAEWRRQRVTEYVAAALGDLVRAEAALLGVVDGNLPAGTSDQQRTLTRSVAEVFAASRRGANVRK